MLQLKDGEYVGVLYDLIEDVIVEQSAIIRATPDAAYRDAKELIAVFNDGLEAYDDSDDDNTTVGRVDETWCFVTGPNGIEWDYPCVRAEERCLAAQRGF